MRSWGWLVVCGLLAGCSVSVGGGVEAGSSKSYSRSWGVGPAPAEDVVDDLDALEEHCKERAERRLSRGGGSFKWRSRRSGRGDQMEFSGTVESGNGGVLQVSCQAWRGQPLREIRVQMQPLKQ